MFGSHEPFDYQQCDACGSLQIATIPNDLARHYPAGFYAFAQSRPWRDLPLRMAKLVWSAIVLFAPKWVHAALSVVPDLRYKLRADRFTAVRAARPRRADRVADVGGGQGELLDILRSFGFRELTCIDPFGPHEGYANGIHYVRTPLAEVSGSFDLLIFFHALEHVPDIDVELRAAREHLRDGGHIIARLPLLPNEAFEVYGADWVQIDAPRHLQVPSRRAFEATAARCGLRVVASGDDSTDFQFWASEAYAKGVPLDQARGTSGPIAARLRPDRRDLRERADRLNRAGRGDQGWYLLARDGAARAATSGPAGALRG